MSPGLAFLQAVLGVGPPSAVLHGARLVPPSTGAGPGRWVARTCKTVPDLAAFLDGGTDTGETHVALAWFSPDAGRSAAGVVARGWISADVDDKEMPAATARERHARGAALVAALPVRTVTVDTGGGFHVHVRLPPGQRVEDFADPEDGRRKSAVLARALRLYLEQKAMGMFGAVVTLDRCHGSERTWRTPSGWNTKASDTTKKRTSDRRLWRPVRLVVPETPAEIALTSPADLSFLGTFLDPAEHEEDEAARSRLGASVVPSRGSALFSLDMLTRGMRGRWPRLQAEGKTESDADWSLACFLRDQGHSPDVAADAIRQRRAALLNPDDREKGQREEYVEQTVRKAYRMEPSVHDQAPPPSRPFLRWPLDMREATRSREPDFRLLDHLLRENDVATMRGRPGPVAVTLDGLAKACEFQAGTGNAWHRFGTQAIRAALERLELLGAVHLPSGKDRETQGRHRRHFLVEVIDPRSPPFVGRLETTPHRLPAEAHDNGRVEEASA